jgi:hypothetical protein
MKLLHFTGAMLLLVLVVANGAQAELSASPKEAMSLAFFAGLNLVVAIFVLLKTFERKRI